MKKISRREQIEARRRCAGCGDRVEHGELFAGVGEIRGHYHCVKKTLGAELFLEACEMGLLPMLKDSEFIGRKLKKFVDDNAEKAKERSEKIGNFVKKMESSGGIAIGPLVENEQDQEKIIRLAR